MHFVAAARERRGRGAGCRRGSLPVCVIVLRSGRKRIPVREISAEKPQVMRSMQLHYS